MTPANRRTFLRRSTQTTLSLAAAPMILANPRSARGAPAADKIVLAAVGAGGRGTFLATHPEWGFLCRGDCEYAYICDPDAGKAGARVKSFAALQGGKQPRPVQDFRQALVQSDDPKFLQQVNNALAVIEEVQKGGVNRIADRDLRTNDHFDSKLGSEKVH